MANGDTGSTPDGTMDVLDRGPGYLEILASGVVENVRAMVASLNASLAGLCGLLDDDDPATPNEVAGSVR